MEEFLRYGSLIGAVIGLVGSAWAGYRAGKDYQSYTGWENNYEGSSQFFNRKPFELDGPAYQELGATRRIDQRVEIVAARDAAMVNLLRVPNHLLVNYAPLSGKPEWTEADGVDKLPEPLRSYYQANPKKLEVDLYRIRTLVPQRVENQKRYSPRFDLAIAYENAHATTLVYPPEPSEPPEIADFQGMRTEPMRFKSPEHTSKLIKKLAHVFGATLVGITKLNPSYVWGYNVRGGALGPFDVPAWWEYAIAFGIPMEWDSFYANPAFGTSFDGYSRVRATGFRLQSYIRQLGYPARMHVPSRSYDVSAPPVAIDAGLGQQGRMGLLVTPELGPNIRLGIITTSLPMAVDRPIDFGVHKFCQKCKICAKSCPSGAISFDDGPPEVIRGCRRWQVDMEACYGFWASSIGTYACRLCLTVCPYSRKNNWIHATARTLASHDPTGIVHSLMLAMQERFFESPAPTDYYPPPLGTNTSYRSEPEWMAVERWLDSPDHGHRQSETRSVAE